MFRYVLFLKKGNFLFKSLAMREFLLIIVEFWHSTIQEFAVLGCIIVNYYHTRSPFQNDRILVKK